MAKIFPFLWISIQIAHGKEVVFKQRCALLWSNSLKISFHTDFLIYRVASLTWRLSELTPSHFCFLGKTPRWFSLPPFVVFHKQMSKLDFC